ncbi:MAG: aminotransferase class V-fold PLP-dependent enzyme [bacterium]
MPVVANKIREDFPVLKRTVEGGKPLIYLDNAATSQKPQIVIDTLKRFYETHNANVHRGIHTLSEESTELYIDAHKKAAAFVSAQSWKEIIFTRNATEAINLVAYAWGHWELKEGDEIVVTIMEHHSNIVPWLNLVRTRGIKLRFAAANPDGTLNVGNFESLISEKTKLVGINHASNVLGTINPVRQLVDTVRRKSKALILVDAAQSAPHFPVNVKALGCDFLALSSHKMMGPTGIGVLYGRRELLESMEPFLYGGDMISEVTTEWAKWNELPWKYEAGTPNFADGVAFGVAIDYLNGIGMPAVEEHERNLTAYALEKLADVPDIILYGPRTLTDGLGKTTRLGVLSFNLKGIHPHDVAGHLNEQGIAVRSGHHCAQPLMRALNIVGACRASLYIYNTEEEIDKLAETLVSIVKLFS